LDKGDPIGSKRLSIKLVIKGKKYGIQYLIASMNSSLVKHIVSDKMPSVIDTINHQIH